MESEICFRVLWGRVVRASLLGSWFSLGIFFFFMGHKVILIFIFKNVVLELTEIKGEERIGIFDDNKGARQ